MEQNRKPYSRILYVGALFIAFYAVVLLRAYHLQILGDKKLNHKVKSQYRANLVIQPKRGAIYDRNGEVLAMDVMVASVGVHPRLIKDKAAALELIRAHTDVPAAKIAAKLSSDTSFTWIERRIPLEDGDAIEAVKMPGVQVDHEFRRYYPNKELAGQLLGAVGYDAKALGGLEMAYDHYLKTESQLTQAERDARGQLFTLTNDPDANNDLHLTIDKNIQHFAEQALTENAVKHGVKNGFAIVMDVATGEIIAMANWPEFNPNNYWSYRQDDWKNHAVIDTFEPGSTFKAVLMAAALQSGEVGPADKFNCEGGHYLVGNHVIKDHGGYGMMTAQQILQVSSNIGVTKIAYKIGKKTFYDFVAGIGFGKKTGVGLAGEAGGFFRSNYAAWRDIEFSNMAFGQGISVTGLQMVTAYSVFANGGVEMRPFAVHKIVNSNGDKVFQQRPEERKRAMNKEAARDLAAMLHTVTQTGGTAPGGAIPGYGAAGKTGTAQKVDPKIRAYAHGQYVSSFIGFTPLDRPRLAIYVVYDTPRKGGYYGGTVAAPVFKKIAENALAYMGVAPGTGDGETTRLARSFLSVKPAMKKAVTKAPEPAVPVKRTSDWNAIKVSLAGGAMPDLKGVSLRELLSLSRSQGAAIEIEGSGFVVSQSPKPLDKLSDRWKLVLASSGWEVPDVKRDDKSGTKEPAVKKNARRKR